MKCVRYLAQRRGRYCLLTTGMRYSQVYVGGRVVVQVGVKEGLGNVQNTARGC